MGENSVNNLLQIAYERGELGLFAAGQGRYFKPDREYGTHWVLGSWKEDIVPIKDHYSEQWLQPIICQMLQELMADEKLSVFQRLDLLLYHYHVFYYLKKEGNFSLDILASCQFNVVDYVLNGYKSHPAPEKINYAVQLIQRHGGLQGLTIPT